jgi:class 3 adenylate cyclase
MYVDQFVDFHVFHSNLLFQLRYDLPLQDNLRLCAASLLEKALDYTDCSAGFHIFINGELGEVHAIALNHVNNHTPSLWKIAQNRNQRVLDGQTSIGSDRNMSTYPNEESQLDPSPRYERYDIPKRTHTWSLFIELDDPFKQPRLDKATSQLVEFTKRLAQQSSSTFSADFLLENNPVIVIPLSRHGYKRLGFMILWGDRPEKIWEWGAIPRHLEDLIQFRNECSQLMVNVFESYYRIKPETYLPSYYVPARKSVVLFSATLRNFEAIARDLSSIHPDEGCLRELVNIFADAVAESVEKLGGRVDQIWNGGLLAVFGEYLDVPYDQERIACMNAVIAAGRAVRLFDRLEKEWLYKTQQKMGHRIRHVIETSLAIGLTFDDVHFDYVGSKSHKVYMAFGDAVIFTQFLADLGAKTKIDPPQKNRYEEPIILSQPVYERANELIQDIDGIPTGTVHQGRLISSRDFGGAYQVYPVLPDNIRDKTS